MEAQARLIHTGRTSMHIAVDISAQDPRTTDRVKTTNCILVYVAMNDNGTPMPVKEWVPTNDEAKALQHYAVKLMDLRKDIDAAMKRFMEGTGD